MHNLKQSSKNIKVPSKPNTRTAREVQANDPKGVSRRILISLVLVSFLGLSGVLSYKFMFSKPNTLESLPNPDLTSVDSRVVEKIRALRREVERNPNVAQLWGNLAMTLHIHDFKLEALPCYKQAIKLDPEEFRWPYYCTIIFSELGAQEAFEWFERSSSLKPDYAPLYLMYGQALFNAGNLEKSREVFHRALTIDETSSHAYLGLGKIALSQDDLLSSQQYLQKALALNPRHREAHGVLAEVLRRLGEPEKATEELQTAQDLPKITPVADPVYEELVDEGISAFWYGERARIYQRKGLTNEAVRELQMALQFAPNPKGYNYLGQLLQQLERFDEAARNYRKAIAMNPNYYMALNNLAQVLFQMDHVEEARTWAERALRLNPRFPEAYITLGTYYMRAGRDSDAIATFRRGLNLTRGVLPIAQRLAWLLATSTHAELRHGRKAVQLAEAVCEKNNYQDAESLDVLAAAYAETGQFPKAIATAQKALKLADSSQQKELADQIQSRLILFQSNKPYRPSDSN